MAKFMVPRKGQGASLGAWRDPEMLKTVPTLQAWLGDTQDDEGHPRETGTLLLFAEGGMIKACLSDRQEGVRAFVTAGTWSDLLAVIDSGLEGGGLDWRLMAGGRGGKK